MHTAALDSISLVIAEGTLLLSPIKPFLMLVPFVLWGWIITRIYDKHAARFFLPRRQWNLAHMIAAVLSLIGFFAIGLIVQNEGAFWAGMGIVLAVLAADLVAYAKVANSDERVPEQYKIGLNMASLQERRDAKRSAKLQAKVELEIRGPGKKILPAPEQETLEYEVRVAAESLYKKSMASRASQLDIRPLKDQHFYGAAVLVDGIAKPLEKLPAPDAIRIIDLWKAAAGLDVKDRRRKLIGRVRVRQDEVSHDAKVITSGVRGGMQMTLLYDPEDAVSRKPAELGLLEPQMSELMKIIEDGKGIVVLAAPPKSGATTSFYAITKMHDAYTSNVQTLEVDPQATLEGIRSNVFELESEAAEFSTTLRSILRRDPDVISVGTVPDNDTALEAVRSDLDRTRIYLAIPAESALAAIDKYTKLVGDPKLAAKALHGVVAQRLLRTLCSNCRVPYVPSESILKKLGLPAGKIKQLYKKGGQVLIKNKPEMCPVCQGEGYLGQTGVFEVFSIGREEQELIKTGNLKGLRDLLRKKQLPTIQQAAILKARDGVTSLEEFTRVIATPGKKPAGRTESKPKSSEAKAKA